MVKLGKYEMAMLRGMWQLECSMDVTLGGSAMITAVPVLLTN